MAVTIDPGEVHRRRPAPIPCIVTLLKTPRRTEQGRTVTVIIILRTDNHPSTPSRYVSLSIHYKIRTSDIISMSD